MSRPGFVRAALLATLVASTVASTCFAQQGASAPPAGSPPPKPATVADANSPKDYSAEAAVIEQVRTEYRFENDGTSTQRQRLTIRVQSEAGVQQLGQLRLGYSAGIQDIKINYVRVRKPDGTVITADPSAVQDMTGPVARTAPMYTDLHEKHVTVPSLRPGDRLEYETVLETKSPLTKGQFWAEHNFQQNIIVLDEQLLIDVPRSRKVQIKTLPEFGKYETKEAGDRTLYTWTFKNLTTAAEREEARKKDKKPRAKRAEKVASVQLSTFESWDDVAKWYSGLERERRTASPEIKAKALELTRDRKNDREKIQAIYDFVATNYRYVSLSFGVGRYQPHAASEIFRNEYGDCKDKHTLLSSMLESLGYSPSTVLIHSQQDLDRDVPSPSQFDHVITRVNAGGQTFWMDTTTEVAPMEMLTETIRGKAALEVKPDGTAAIVETPEGLPFESIVGYDFEGKISELGRLAGRVKRTLRGDVELAIRSALRSMPQANWKTMMEFLARTEGMEITASNVTTSSLTDTSKPLVLEYDIAASNYIDWTGKDANFPLPMPRYLLATGEGDESLERIELGGPVKVESSLKVTLPARVSASTKVPLAVSVKRDYAEYHASTQMKGNDLVGTRVLAVSARHLPAERSKDIASFVRIINSDHAQQVRARVPGEDAGAPVEAKIEELEDAAYSALTNGRYKTAADLYARVTEQDAKHPRAWNNLGRAYTWLGEFKKAEEALKKAIEINAYDEWAYNNLGRVYEIQQKYDDAIASYRKQIEVNPLDAGARANLGSLLARRRRYDEAVPELERSRTIASDNPFVLQVLGEAYLKTGRTEEAMDAFNKALEKAPTPVMWNNVAYTLATEKQKLDRAQQYAESAVSNTATQLRNLAIDQAGGPGLVLSASLATYWDTLGWVYYQKGDLDRAEKYLLASWQQSQNGEVADHVAQLHEKRGQKDKAVEMYAYALAATQSVPESRDRLKALLGKSDVDKLVDSKRPLLGQQRTIKLDWPKSDGNAEVVLSFGAGGVLEDVSFLTGEEQFKAQKSQLMAVKFPVSYPDAGTTRFMRKGLVSCTQTNGCVLVLMPADELSLASSAAVLDAFKASNENESNEN
ncbi:MAG TPA: DUF3857 domain-containing protein [Clostridia bacterium]|nr:DUF3857 domain-containing protein [Clostridia bacterium]